MHSSAGTCKVRWTLSCAARLKYKEYESRLRRWTVLRACMLDFVCENNLSIQVCWPCYRFILAMYIYHVVY